MKKTESMDDRMNRRELRLVRALDEVGMAAENITGLPWFKGVMTAWMKPQSPDKKYLMRATFIVAARSIDFHSTSGGKNE